MTPYFCSADDPKVLTELRSTIYRAECILVIGSGLSAHAWTKEGQYPPSWKGLLEKITHWSSEKGLIDQETTEGIHVLLREGFLIEAGQEIEEHLREHSQQDQCLKEALLYDETMVNEIHCLIAKIPFRAYLTTNYDTFIETAYHLVKGITLAKFYETSIQGAIIQYREYSKRENRPFILKLHGDIDNPNSIILGDRAFERFLHRASNYERDLEKLLAMSSILFIGFGKADHDFEGFLTKIDVFGQSNRHWMVVPEGLLPALKAKRLWKDRGVRIIQYKDDEVHSKLVAFLNELTAPLSPTRLDSEEGARIISPSLEPASAGERQVAPRTEGSRRRSGPLSSTPESTRTIEVFYSWSLAKEDEELRKKLDGQLGILQNKGLIKYWHVGKVNPGEDTELEIMKHLNSAQIILLLLSNEFMVGDAPHYEIEMKRAMERYKSGEVSMIPVLLRPTFGWEDEPFGKLQPLPTDNKAVTLWGNQDEAFNHIAAYIQAAVEKLHGNPHE